MIAYLEELREKAIGAAATELRPWVDLLPVAQQILVAVMEGRLFRLWQTLVYIGGWAVINGALLWLMQYWDSLSRPGKLLLGSVPAITSRVLRSMVPLGS